MADVPLNKLVSDLRACCVEHPLAEKWLLAPTRRLGQQWLDTLTRAGQPVLNVHLESIETLALLRLAAPDLARRGLGFVRGVALEVLVTRLFARLRQEGGGYLLALEPTPGLIRTLTNTLSDLRLAGLSAKGLSPQRFEVSEKGREIAALLAAYEQELQTGKLVDYAGVLQLAAARVRSDPSALPDDAQVLLPEDMSRDLRPLERMLWEAIPADRRVVLRVDAPNETPEGELTDASLLRWIADPTAAPAPVHDGTATIARAVGEVNEVRAVFQQGLPLDQVEVLYTDSETYLPLLYEFASRLWADEPASLPVTFAEGIPVRYSRPARALLGWLTWIREGFTQTALAHLVQEGLLAAPEGEISYTRLAALLRGLPIGRGRERYLQVLDAELEAVSRRLAGAYEMEDLDDPSEYAQRQRARGAGLKALRAIVATLLADWPEVWDQRNALTAALRFVKHHARLAGKLDEYSRERMTTEMRRLLECLEAGDVPGLDVMEWLTELVHALHVDAQGPRAGCLLVSPLLHGGHAGRAHTIILGLDDGRFPGAGSQDPLLLDKERTQLSRDLPTGAGRLARQVQTLAELFARLRGTVTLSYSCRSLEDDRAQFPSSVVWSAYRILSGEREGDQEAMARWLHEPPTSFAPSTPDRCLEPGDWWLWRMCGEQVIADPEAALAVSFPHLRRGFEARRARESDLFTEYDGYVPEAGALADPTRDGGPVLSASRLETMGQCPLGYFLKYVLEVRPPDEYDLDPTMWLSPAERGSLLHDVFRRIMSTLAAHGRVPECARDEGLAEQILADEIASWKLARPPHHPEVFARECEELRQIARVFLREEARYCRTSQPVCFEACIGLPLDGTRGFLDTPRPVPITLPDGSVVRARARLDRVDRLAGSQANAYTIWDYKTGSSGRYQRSDPFNGGRHLQNALYLALAQARLEEVSPDAEVTAFGYFFPNLRDYGDRLLWAADELAGGASIIAHLCRLIAAGCFPFTDNADDVRYSDYTDAFGDVEAAVAAAARKLQNPRNGMLAPFRTLRQPEGQP